MILDVGSGTLPLHQSLKGDNVVHVDIWRGEHLVNVLADTHKLPFRDNAFTCVYASHVLEHCDHPLQVLHEFCRVSPKAYIRVPLLNAYSRVNCQSSIRDHLYTWNYFSFENLLKKVYPHVILNVRINSLERFHVVTRMFILWKRAIIFRKNDELVAKCWRDTLAS